MPGVAKERSREGAVVNREWEGRIEDTVTDYKEENVKVLCENHSSRRRIERENDRDGRFRESDWERRKQSVYQDGRNERLKGIVGEGLENKRN